MSQELAELEHAMPMYCITFSILLCFCIAMCTLFPYGVPHNSGPVEVDIGWFASAPSSPHLAPDRVWCMGIACDVPAACSCSETACRNVQAAYSSIQTGVSDWGSIRRVDSSKGLCYNNIPAREQLIACQLTAKLASRSAEAAGTLCVSCESGFLGDSFWSLGLSVSNELQLTQPGIYLNWR